MAPAPYIQVHADQFPYFSLVPQYSNGIITIRDGRREILSRGNRRKRIAFVGDSVTFGSGISDKQTFVELLQSQQTDYDVYNFGVEGYGVPEIKTVVKKLAESSNYQVVFYLYDYNDIFPSMSGYLSLIPDQQHRFRVIEDYQGLYGTVKLFLKDHLKLFFVLEFAFKKLIYPKNKALKNIQETPSLQRIDQASKQHNFSILAALWDKAYADPKVVLDLKLFFQSLNRICKKQGVIFIVAIHQDYLIMKENRSIPRRSLEKIFVESGIKHIDLYNIYRDHYSDNDFYSDPAHLGPHGNRLVADVILNELID